jgi:hypothetical protein
MSKDHLLQRLAKIRLKEKEGMLRYSVVLRDNLLKIKS